MKKQIFFLAVAALALASCSSDKIAEEKQVAQQQTADPSAVTFDAYTNRSTTRAGKSGIMKDAELKTTGFGVFGFYTDNNDYEQSRIPDFFYNQLVKWVEDTDPSKSYWTYEPIKYWPNEYGNSAISDDNDRVTYFAYAPYVEVTPASGKLVKKEGNDDQWGITGMSRNNATGDPLIKYIASFDADKSVDLLWGVCDDTNWPIVQGGTTQSINEGVKGLPWLNVQRPKDVNHKMKFTFKHALAQLSVTVDAYVDDIKGGNQLADGTKIYIRQISFTGFALKGALNLNNDDANIAKWFDYNGTADLESGAAIVVYDQRKDGKEGADGAVATNEKVGGLNAALISDDGNTQQGVTASTQRLFQSADPVMVIPTGEDMEVEIVYDVETADDNLSTLLSDGKTLGSSIENRIKKTVSFGTTNLTNGYHYTLALHLGMNSVKFDASVSDWQEDSNRPEADLPFNMPSFAAKSNPTATSVNIAANTTAKQDYVFAVTGLTPGEAVAVTPISLVGVTAGLTTTTSTNSSFTGGTELKANDSGVIYVKVQDIAKYNDTKNKLETGYISVKGSSSNGEVRLAINQLARALDFVGSSVNALADKKLTVKVNTELDNESAWSQAGAGTGTPAAKLTVKKNGEEVSGATLSNPSTTTADISIASGVAVGDVFEITIKTGDAPAETRTMTVGGIYFSNPITTVTVGSTVTNVPVIVGKGTVTYSSSDVAASVDTSGKVEGKTKKDNVTITAVLTSKNNDIPSGYFYPTGTDDLKDTYIIKVVPQAATISITKPTVQNAETGTSSVVAEAPAVLKDAKGNVITTNSPNVTYSLSVNDGADNDKFKIEEVYKVKSKKTTPAGSYKIKVTATPADTEYYEFNGATAEYEVTVTVSNP